MTGDAKPRIHAIVLAGGAGERFWPASRCHHPKPFLEVVGGRSLLEATLDRARQVAADDCVWIICGDEHADAMVSESGLPAGRILVEPQRRNTAMAVAWGALHIAAEDPEAILCVLPADHHIPDGAAFADALRRAARAAAEAEVLVTLGVRPSRPDTGYGYIRVGEAAGGDFEGLHAVASFVAWPFRNRPRTGA